MKDLKLIGTLFLNTKTGEKVIFPVGGAKPQTENGGGAPGRIIKQPTPEFIRDSKAEAESRKTFSLGNILGKYRGKDKLPKNPML